MAAGGLLSLASTGCQTTSQKLGKAAGPLAVGAAAALVAAGMNHAANAPPTTAGDRTEEDIARERRNREQTAREDADAKLRAVKPSEQMKVDDYPPP